MLNSSNGPECLTLVVQRGLSGEHVASLELVATSSVTGLKQAIAEHINVPPELQQLVRAGESKPLDDDATLLESGLKDGDVLDLITAAPCRLCKDTEADALAELLMPRVHSRAWTYWQDEELVKTLVRKFAHLVMFPEWACLDTTMAAAMLFDISFSDETMDRCCIWSGDELSEFSDSSTHQGEQAQVIVSVPSNRGGTYSKRLAFANRVLVFLFANDDVFETYTSFRGAIRGASSDPFRMKCGNQKCVCLAHVDTSVCSGIMHDAFIAARQDLELFQSPKVKGIRIGAHTEPSRFQSACPLPCVPTCFCANS